MATCCGDRVSLWLSSAREGLYGIMVYVYMVYFYSQLAISFLAYIGACRYSGQKHCTIIDYINSSIIYSIFLLVIACFCRFIYILFTIMAPKIPEISIKSRYNRFRYKNSIDVAAALEPSKKTSFAVSLVYSLRLSSVFRWAKCFGSHCQLFNPQVALVADFNNFIDES